MNPSSEDIGRRIRALRKEKGFTLAKMAELCQCSSSLLSQIETGAVNPSFSTLKSISDALGISMASLFETSITLKDTPVCPIHANERKTLTTEGGVSLESVYRPDNGMFEDGFQASLPTFIRLCSYLQRPSWAINSG